MYHILHVYIMFTLRMFIINGIFCMFQCHLAEHMAMHSNNRQFLCDVCGASFKTKSCQLKHVRNIHQNPRSFPCNVCEKRFNTNYALKRHERTHENDLKMMPASANVLVPQNFLADVSAQAELVQATDIIIAPPMDESFEQGSDVKLQQVLSENNSAIMFLSSSLPTSWSWYLLILVTYVFFFGGGGIFNWTVTPNVNVDSLRLFSRSLIYLFWHQTSRMNFVTTNFCCRYLYQQ